VGVGRKKEITLIPEKQDTKIIIIQKTSPVYLPYLNKRKH
jgi:hypothetical protein